MHFWGPYVIVYVYVLLTWLQISTISSEVINAFAKAASWQQALQVVSLDGPLNVAQYTTVLNACGRGWYLLCRFWGECSHNMSQSQISRCSCGTKSTSKDWKTKFSWNQNLWYLLSQVMAKWSCFCSTNITSRSSMAPGNRWKLRLDHFNYLILHSSKLFWCLRMVLLYYRVEQLRNSSVKCLLWGLSLVSWRLVDIICGFTKLFLMSAQNLGRWWAHVTNMFQSSNGITWNQKKMIYIKKNTAVKKTLNDLNVFVYQGACDRCNMKLRSLGRANRCLGGHVQCFDQRVCDSIALATGVSPFWSTWGSSKVSEAL